MKKYLIILLLLFIPTLVNAEVCDTSKITIDSIILKEKTDNVEEVSKASANGKNINIDLSMSELGDSARYEITLKNDSSSDYELEEGSFSIDSDYIDYSLESLDESNIIKANSIKTVYLKVSYNKAVPEEEFLDGSYQDNKSGVVNLSTDEIEPTPSPTPTRAPEEVIVPNTNTSYIVSIVIVGIFLSITLIYLLKMDNKVLVLILGLLVIMPISVNALCKCEINVDSKVEIVKTRMKEVCLIDNGHFYKTNYEEGSTWFDFIYSEYNNLPFYTNGSGVSTNTMPNGDFCQIRSLYLQDKLVKLTDTIVSCEEGQYNSVAPIC